MIRKDRVTCSFSFRILYSLQVGGRKKGADLRQAIISRRVSAQRLAQSYAFSVRLTDMKRLVQRQAHRHERAQQGWT
jgi:hypothetical protein